jgi:hypothetical protein
MMNSLGSAHAWQEIEPLLAPPGDLFAEYVQLRARSA